MIKRDLKRADPVAEEGTSGRAEVRLHTLAANTSVVVWYTGPDGAMTALNPSFGAFTGRAPRQYLGWKWLGAVHPEDAKHLFDAVQRDVAAERPATARYRMRRYDGEYRLMAAQVAPIREDGRICEWVGVSIDVTEQAEAEAALRANEARLQFLDDLVGATRNAADPTAIMRRTARMMATFIGATSSSYAEVHADAQTYTVRASWDADGELEEGVAHPLDVLGREALAAIGRGDSFALENAGPARLHAPGLYRLESESVLIVPLLKDNRPAAMLAVTSILPRTWSREVVSLIYDAADRCWAHVQRVRDHLLLLEQDRNRDHFLATLAHELSNPLSAISYAAATLRQSSSSRKTVETCTAAIERQLGLIRRLVADIFDLAAVKRGQLKLQPTVVVPDVIVNDAVAVAGPSIALARHDLRALVLDVHEAGVLGDPARLTQALSNLLVNAAKYTPDGGTITVSVTADAAAVTFRVQDNGPGLTADERARLLLGGGWRGSHSTVGLGLGLELVKNVVSIHGGKTEVASEGSGLGSAFSIELPRIYGHLNERCRILYIGALDAAEVLSQLSSLPVCALATASLARARAIAEMLHPTVMVFHTGVEPGDHTDALKDLVDPGAQVVWYGDPPAWVGAASIPNAARIRGGDLKALRDLLAASLSREKGTH
ncbi:sensor histidine kinase [Ramlibacter humi]|uniref:histidine kinase n=1 Tax=Ramlibacter humi TaxID=2530451 RepID=A0A4Z0BPE9_9BURK|nr:ATP-binding protein [Ramlibacter humi]TFZ00290.1 PAS domain S-box protein [Ramlibacter humi]